MHFSQAQYFASVAWWIIGQKLKKGGFIITFSEVLSYICNLYNSMNIICATQLSQNIIYGFLLGVWKCTCEADSRVAPPRCLLTLYSGWNIKDANVSTNPGVILRRHPNKSDEMCGTAHSEIKKLFKSCFHCEHRLSVSSLNCHWEVFFFYLLWNKLTWMDV